MKSRTRRAWRAIKIAALLLFTIVFVPVVFALIGVGVECRVIGGRVTQPDSTTSPADVPAPIKQLRQDPVNYIRGEDRTYLTLPEWYIVYSADEYAAFTTQGRPSHFPFFGAIRQFWSSYYDVCAVTREQYPLNTGSHLTLVVIGASFTVENMLHGIYENTVGRVTEWLSAGGQTEEDVYAHTVAQEYGTFLHTIPWYEFPYGARLRGLWSGTSLWGPNITRKWERKLALSTEYGAKAAYAWVIKKATRSVYAPDELKIQMWATGVTPEVVEREPEVRLLQDLASRGAIVETARYEAFTQIVPRLVAQGVQFVEIAGNDEIMVTLIAPRDWRYDLADGTLLLEMPVLTQPNTKRVAVNVPVTALHRVLSDLGEREIQFEHVYDY